VANADPSQPGGNGKTSNVIPVRPEHVDRSIPEQNASREQGTVVVLADGSMPLRKKLEELCGKDRLFVGNSLDAVTRGTSDATVIFNWSGSRGLLRDVFLSCPKLRWIHSRSAGLERSLFPELIASPVLLTNGTGVFSSSLGEFALAAILYFAKDLRRIIRNQMKGVWEPFDVLMAAEQTVGIIGYGDIGHAVAARVRSLGMKILAVKRNVPPYSDALADEIYGRDSLLQILPRCDYVVVTTPLTEKTRGMIGEREIAAMRSTAVVINLGRGPVINEQALLQALSRNRIKGAALDVFDEEPLPAGHEFYKLENVLLSPHCADHTADWLDEAMQLFLEQLQRFQTGRPLLNIVDKKLGY
jgi:phosphoglycerate dehydrogenase-like enzyme